MSIATSVTIQCVCNDAETFQLARGFALGFLIRNIHVYATRNPDIVGKLPSPWLDNFAVTAYVK